MNAKRRKGRKKNRTKPAPPPLWNSRKVPNGKAVDASRRKSRAQRKARKKARKS